MLYVTTRNNRDTFTVQHALTQDRGPDGGQFVPFHSPVFSSEEVHSLLNQSFDECVAKVLNRLLGTTLSGWDVSFYTGRNAVRVQNLGHRLLIAEAWHNPDWCFDRMIQNLANLTSNQGALPSFWFKIAVKIAVFAGICAETSVASPQYLDFAVVASDFSSPMAAWYARDWGFPIGNIICCCNENGNLWDLFANGQMRTDGICLSTNTPDADHVLPAGLEQLIYSCGGTSEVHNYLDASQQGRIYIPSDPILKRIRDGIYVSVVGDERMLQTIPRGYASRNYLMSPYDALCYCGVSDYRARYGETGTVVIFSEKSPVCAADVVAEALGVAIKKLKDH